MKRNSARLLGMLSLLFSLSVLAQFKTPSASASVEQAAHASAADAKTAPAPAPESKEPLPPLHPSSTVQVLTKLNGFNLQPYLDSMVPIVRDEWYAAIHEVVKNPNYRRGTVVAEFAVTRTGEVQDFKITVPSGEDDLDQAVSQALQKASPLPAIPKAVVSDDLRFRMNFFYMGRKPSKWWRR